MGGNRNLNQRGNGESTKGGKHSFEKDNLGRSLSDNFSPFNNSTTGENSGHSPLNPP